MRGVSIATVDELSDDERRALRTSRFGGGAALPAETSAPKPKRLAHPGGPVVTNKAAALARFLKRKLQDPEGLAGLNPELVERAVKAAKRGSTTKGPSERAPNGPDFEDREADSSGARSSEDGVAENGKEKKTKVLEKPKKKIIKFDTSISKGPERSSSKKKWKLNGKKRKQKKPGSDWD